MFATLFHELCAPLLCLLPIGPFTFAEVIPWHNIVQWCTCSQCVGHLFINRLANNHYQECIFHYVFINLLVADLLELNILSVHVKFVTIILREIDL